MQNSGPEPLSSIASLKKEELDFLAAVAKRAYQSVLHHSREVYLKTPNRRIQPLKKLHVASLSFSLPDPLAFVKEFRQSSGKQWSPAPYELLVFRNGGERLLAIAEDFLQQAARNGTLPHFLLLNELSHAFEERDDLESGWAALAKRYEIYIVPGTFHCTSEFFGVAPIYCPDPRKNSYALKQNSAIKQGERIRTPDNRELVIYETDFGNIVLWVCLDIYDPGLVLKFLNTSNRFTGSRKEREAKDREISLVLIPAYSYDDKANIANCIQSISRFSKTAMVCTNSFGGSSRLESHAFSCGEPLTTILERTYPFAGEEKPFCEAQLFEVDLDQLRWFQAQSYQQNGIFSSSFSAIINGGPYSFRDVPE